MLILYFLLAIVTFLVIGYCGWLIWTESNQKPTTGTQSLSTPEKDIKTPIRPAITSDGKGLPINLSFLKKLNLPKMSLPIKGFDQIKSIRKPNILGFINKPDFTKIATQLSQVAAQASEEKDTGTADLRLDDVFAKGPQSGPTKEPTEPPSELSKQCQVLEAQIQESQNKYQQLDKLFQEKSQILRETEDSLSQETLNRKEFNKIKDLLEKELKDSKERCRDLEIDLAHAETDSKSHLERISQLEDKIKKAEQELAVQEEETRKAQLDNKKEQQRINELTNKFNSIQAEIKIKDEKIHGLVDNLKEKSAMQKTSEQSPLIDQASQAFGNKDTSRSDELLNLTPNEETDTGDKDETGVENPGDQISLAPDILADVTKEIDENKSNKENDIKPGNDIIPPTESQKQNPGSGQKKDTNSSEFDKKDNPE